ncbi:unnamed protein product [Brassica rapa subsp. narinosa]
METSLAPVKIQNKVKPQECEERRNNNFRLTDALLFIRFNDGTSFENLTDSNKVIPTELFRFRRALANTNKQFPDIIGELSAIRSTINDNLPGAKRIMLTLRLDSAVKVWVSQGADQQASSSKMVHAQKIEPLTISELNQFIITADSQGIGVHAQVDTELHRSLAEIVGKTYTFHKLNDFNFALKHQTFTISRIFPERELAPMPAFVIPLEGANAPEEALHEVVAPGTEEKDANTCNVAEESHPRLMLPLPDVLHRPKNKLLLIGMPARKHVWNESTTSS